jgi:hypothetical protein
LATRHVASGKKIIFACKRELPIGHVVRRWAASDERTSYDQEWIEDQPLVVVRQATFEEFLEHRPAEFAPVGCKRAPAGFHFYELTCE